MNLKVKENYLRRQAARLGLFLQKSRGKKWRIDNQLGYRIIEIQNKQVISGERFEMTLDQVEKELNEIEKTMSQ